MRNKQIYIPKEIPEDNYDQVASDPELRSVSSESDLADSPAGQTIRSSYHSPIFGDHNPLEPCPVNGCPLNPQSGVMPHMGPFINYALGAEGRINLNFLAHSCGTAVIILGDLLKYPIKTFNSKIDFKPLKRARIWSFFDKKYF